MDELYKKDWDEFDTEYKSMAVYVMHMFNRGGYDRFIDYDGDHNDDNINIIYNIYKSATKQPQLSIYTSTVNK